ncbi:hypothetical protein [Proteiniclasticum sp. QWL-01]|jgi:hypothetical protein|uniref:hypothetical protein n=1 Tax=Proteiniclasticum sp. QWL-01 TaxID=3036945 RepID=UPI0024116267|nr:hypothetical protein [Proteiniclasticum sp. QWL-01]WFF73572.1 hypothetical protein P6M73_03735 [Proteiniclasticum sp. QWL-01]
MTDQYDDIIHLPHHISSTRPRMSGIDRAAQFSPFAALTGYDASIKESARLTDARIELDDSQKEEIGEKLRLVTGQPDAEIKITYFLPDTKKTGGKYVLAAGTVKKVDEYERMIIMGDGKQIPIDEVIDVDCDVFGEPC